MFRLLLRLIVLVVVLGVVAVVLIRSGLMGRIWDAAPAVETSGSGIDTERARETGAEIAERIARGASKAEDALAETRFTAKIKSKIALDDTLNGSRIDVTTRDTTVTLTGSVRSTAQRERAVQLARETAGVTSVLDRLEIDQR
jgi:osmotically-inducible protein OsmY